MKSRKHSNKRRKTQNRRAGAPRPHLSASLRRLRMNYGGSRRWPSQAEQEKIRAEREQAMFENQVQANLSYLCERISFRSLENAREYLAETLSEHNRYNRNNPIQSEVMRRFQLIAQEYIRHLENGGNVRQVIPI